jgi:hypothetical protein
MIFHKRASTGVLKNVEETGTGLVFRNFALRTAQGPVAESF